MLLVSGVGRGKSSMMVILPIKDVPPGLNIVVPINVRLIAMYVYCTDR